MEFLSPALAKDAQGSDLAHDQLHEKQHPNFWLAIYNEELTESEENRGNDKSHVLILDFVNVLLSLTDSHGTHANTCPACINLKYPFRPPLFQLHCIYLI